MANFQPYDDASGREARARWSRGLDGIFEAYQASKQAADAKRQASNQSVLQNGFDATSPELAGAPARIAAARVPAQPGIPATPDTPLNPGQIMSALQPNQDPVQGVMGLMANNPGSPAVAPTPERYNQLSHYDEAVKSHMDKRAAAADLSTRHTEADIRDKNSQSVQREADARLKDRMPNLGGRGSVTQLTPIQSAALQWGLDQGLVATEDISARGPRSAIMADGIAGRSDFQAYNKERERTGKTGLENFNPRQNSINTAAAKAGASASARLTEGGSSQVVARAANSATEQLDILQEMSDKFPRSDVRFMNTAINAIDVQTHPEAQNWRVALNSARTEYATALNRGNSPTKELMDEARVALPDNITPKQLPGAISTLRRGLAATVKGQMTAAGSTKADKGADPLGLF